MGECQEIHGAGRSRRRTLHYCMDGIDARTNWTQHATEPRQGRPEKLKEAEAESAFEAASRH